MNKKSWFNLIARCSLWGGIIGFLVGIPYFFVLWAYGILGLFVNAIVGWILGILNGLTLGLLYKFTKNNIPARSVSFTISALVIFIASFIIYSFIYSPLVRYSPNPTLVVILLSPLPIATITAGFFSQRALKWYSGFKNET